MVGGKEKKRKPNRKEKKERQTIVEVFVVLAGLRLIKAGVEGLKEVATGAKRLKEAATGARGLASLLLPLFLLLPFFLLLSASSASRQAFFLVLINASSVSSSFSVFYSFFKNLLLCFCYLWHKSQLSRFFYRYSSLNSKTLHKISPLSHN